MGDVTNKKYNMNTDFFIVGIKQKIRVISNMHGIVSINCSSSSFKIQP
jgi:hypothetical protein